jgi:hypothetical protein
MENPMWRSLILAAALAVSVPASIVVTAGAASAEPACGAITGTAVWSTQRSYSYFPGGWCMKERYAEVVWQSDGNLVWYRFSDGLALWASGTSDRTSTLVFRKDGNIVIYSSHGLVEWAIGGAPPDHRTASTYFYWQVYTVNPQGCGLGNITHYLWHHQTSPDYNMQKWSRCDS